MEKLTRAELYAIIKQKGIKGYSLKPKADMLKLLQEQAAKETPVVKKKITPRLVGIVKQAPSEPSTPAPTPASPPTPPPTPATLPQLPPQSPAAPPTPRWRRLSDTDSDTQPYKTTYTPSPLQIGNLCFSKLKPWRMFDMFFLLRFLWNTENRYFSFSPIHISVTDPEPHITITIHVPGKPWPMKVHLYLRDVNGRMLYDRITNFNPLTRQQELICVFSVNDTPTTNQQALSHDTAL